MQRCRDIRDRHARILQQLPRQLAAQVFEQFLGAAALRLESLPQPARLDAEDLGDLVG